MIPEHMRMGRAYASGEDGGTTWEIRKHYDGMEPRSWEWSVQVACMSGYATNEGDALRAVADAIERLKRRGQHQDR